MKGRDLTLRIITCLGMAFFMMSISGVSAQEVNKDEIPEEHLKETFKKLPWDVQVWDTEEAIESLNEKEAKTLWIDTRPDSLYNKGTVCGALLMPYNKTGEEGNELNQEELEKALEEAGLKKEEATLILFCQGPKCHRSYNATYIMVKEWGFTPKQVVWFRGGYPNLFKAVKADAKLKRKAKRYLSEEALKQL